MQKPHKDNHFLTPAQKAYRKQLQREARTKFAGVVVANSGVSIEITNKSIKEWLNQPHPNYFEKNELVKYLENVLKEATFVGEVTDVKHGLKNPIKVYKTDRMENAFLIVRKNPSGVFQLYGVTKANIVEKEEQNTHYHGTTNRLSEHPAPQYDAKVKNN